MEKKRNIFEDDELDRAVTAADDTGLISSEQTVVEEEILEHTGGEEPPEDEVP